MDLIVSINDLISNIILNNNEGGIISQALMHAYQIIGFIWNSCQMLNN
jgi:hypothetical protein